MIQVDLVKENKR